MNASQRADLDRLYQGYSSPRSHAECVALSRQKGQDRERLAAEAAAIGDHETAAEHRRIAKRYRDEADAQDLAAPRTRTIITGGSHPAEPEEPGPIFRRTTLVPLD